MRAAKPAATRRGMAVKRHTPGQQGRTPSGKQSDWKMALERWTPDSSQTGLRSQHTPTHLNRWMRGGRADGESDILGFG